MWAVGLILLGWLGCFLKEGYKIWVFAVAHFQIFPGLKQVHKKGKCHNGYSTSVLNGHHSDKPVLENHVKIPMSSSHPVSIVTFQVVTIQFPCEIPCYNSEKRQVFGSFSLLNTFGFLTGIFPFAFNGNYISWIWVWGVQVMTCTIMVHVTQLILGHLALQLLHHGNLLDHIYLASEMELICLHAFFMNNWRMNGILKYSEEHIWIPWKDVYSQLHKETSEFQWRLPSIKINKRKIWLMSKFVV